LVAMGTVVASLASSLYSLVVGLHDQSLTVPPPPRWLAELPLVGQKLTEAWLLVATNVPAAVAKYGGALSEPAARLGSSAAGLWTVVMLLLCIVQVPAVLVTLPIIAYVLATEATQPAIIFVVWTLVAGLSDNVLKPLLLGRGLEVPMPVILIGVIGGMIADGLLGLFVGPVVLAVGYVLLIEWMRQRRAQRESSIADRTL